VSFHVHVSWRLGWQLDVSFLLDHSGDVQIEEVCIENCLNDSSNDGDRIQVIFGVEAVDPVEDVQSTVRTQSEEIVSSDGFSRSGCLKHVELRHDGDRFQVDAESPEDFHNRILVIDQEGEDEGRNNQELHSEGVVISVVSRLELDENQINSADGGCQEEEFHHRIVQRHEVSEQIQVPTGEHNHEEH